MKYLTIILLSLFMTTTAQAQVSIKRSSKTIFSDGYEYYIHSIKKGETVYSLSKAYDVSEASILDKNPFIKHGLRVNQTILIPTKTAHKAWLKNNGDTIPSPDRAELITSTDPETDRSIIEDSIALELEKIPVRPTTGQTKHFDPLQPINVTILLPFEDGKLKLRHTEFLNGVLIALDNLKTTGISTNLDIISFGGRDSTLSADIAAQASELISGGKLDKANLIIGPVYKTEFAIIAQWATENHVPIVSPLMTNEVESPYVFQATPKESLRFKKLETIFCNSNIVILKTEETTEEALLTNILEYAPPSNILLKENVTRASIQSLSELLSRDRHNVIVLPTSSKSSVTTILEKLSLLNTSAKYPLTVVGLSTWAGFDELQLETLFKLNVVYITNYYENRTDEKMFKFYAKYIETFTNIPSKFSMRGYDVASMFISALHEWGPDMPLKMQNFEATPLQVKYIFKQTDGASNFSNQEWVLVNHNNDSKIVLE